MEDVQSTTTLPENMENPELITEQELEERVQKIDNGFRRIFFPILGVEVSRVSLLCMIFSLITFIYTFLRIYKDNIIYTVLEPSAQNYLKFFTFVVSFLFVGILQKLLLYFDVGRVFEIGTISFGVMFLALAGLLFFRTTIQFDELATPRWFVMSTLFCRGMGLRTIYMLSLILNHWVLSMYYILIEVVGSIMVGYFFMAYVNSNFSVGQNGRYVTPIYFFSNIASFFASYFMEKWVDYIKGQPVSTVEICYLLFTGVAGCLFFAIFVLKRVVDRICRNNPIVISSGKPKKVKTKKSASFNDGVYYAIVSKFLAAMCVMTLAYNFITILSGSLFSNANSAYTQYYRESSYFGTQRKSLESKRTSLLTMVVLFVPVARYFIKSSGILIPSLLPIILAFGFTFATCVIAAIDYPLLGEDNMPIVGWLGELSNLLKLELDVSLATVCAVKITKYAFFDIAKEAISMKINPEIRTLFKGVFDGLCGKLGKLLGAGYGIIMEEITGVRDARYYVPVTVVLLTISCIVWTFTVFYIHRSYSKACKEDAYMSPDYISSFKLKDE